MPPSNGISLHHRNNGFRTSSHLYLQVQHMQPWYRLIIIGWLTIFFGGVGICISALVGSNVLVSTGGKGWSSDLFVHIAGQENDAHAHIFRRQIERLFDLFNGLWSKGMKFVHPIKGDPRTPISRRHMIRNIRKFGIIMMRQILIVLIVDNGLIGRTKRKSIPMLGGRCRFRRFSCRRHGRHIHLSLVTRHLPIIYVFGQVLCMICGSSSALVASSNQPKPVALTLFR
mmetsp:Transcript_23107/g.41728  ORF Transcript_23107/g.41728 Transcript_23107/m.41728 type:complete len:228 (-) Transcript_23107:7-690(-)